MNRWWLFFCSILFLMTCPLTNIQQSIYRFKFFLSKQQKKINLNLPPFLFLFFKIRWPLWYPFRVVHGFWFCSFCCCVSAFSSWVFSGENYYFIKKPNLVLYWFDGNRMCRKERGKKQPTWRVFSLKELHAATNNFNYDNKLGEGGFGSVYWGQLWDGSQVITNIFSYMSNFFIVNSAGYSVKFSIIYLIDYGFASSFLGERTNKSYHSWFYYFKIK